MQEVSHFNHIARHIAQAVENTPAAHPNEGKVIEIPGDSATPEVVAQLRSMGVEVLIANRKKRRGIRARQRSNTEPLKTPKVFADGHADPEYRRKQRNKAKAERRSRHK